jgi:glutamate/tyrosine decarboxylase-like PLP-dependent enzyme
MLRRASEALQAQFARLPEYAASPAMGLPIGPAIGFDEEAAERVLELTAHRLGDNFPYFHPLYAGQMLKPPHPVARAAYALAMQINPNNHARDGGRASSAMEVEAVEAIAAMFGWSQAKNGGDSGHLGHLTSSGTVANLEALWMAGQLHPDKRVIGSEQAHYTHGRISAVLRVPYASVAADAAGRMDLNALESELRQGDVGTVVVTLGTTAIGAVDPLDEILALQPKYGFRVHVDAAYGGYFTLIPDELDEPARRAFAAIGQADSIVIDPHKHGLQPYGCGCVLFRDPAVGRFYKHDSPYTYFTSKELHLGEISLECSRAGAAAVALWATQQLLPLAPGGEFARGLASGRRAAKELARRLAADERFVILKSAARGPTSSGPTLASPTLGGFANRNPSAHSKGSRVQPPELDIVVWALHAAGSRTSSVLAPAVFDRCAEKDLHLALVQLPHAWFPGSPADSPDTPDDAGGLLTCLRSVLMKPEHEAWLGRIWERLSAAADEVLRA